MRTLGLVASLMSLVAISGCARSAPDNPELLAGALPAQAAPQQTFASSAAAGDVVDGWLKTFADPQLPGLVSEALTYNRDLAIAAARVQQAAASARLAGAALSPTISAGIQGSTGGTGGGNTANTAGVGLQLSWEIDVWGRMSSASAAATATFAAREADFAFARQSLAAQVAKAWWFAIQASQQEALAREFVQIQAKSHELVALRNTAGMATELDVTIARAALSQAEEREQQAAQGRAEAVRSLEVLLGRYPKSELGLAANLPDMPPAPPAGIPSQVLERRPDLIAATRRVAAAFNQVESAKAARLPRLSITATGGRASDDLRGLGSGNPLWNVAGNFLGPIFDGGRLKEQVNIEKGAQEEALAAYGQAALNAFKQVENALAGESRLATRETLILAAAADNMKGLSLADAQFKGGMIDMLGVLQLQTRALDTRIAALALRNERLNNRIDLHLALGGSFEAPPPAPEDALPASKPTP